MRNIDSYKQLAVSLARATTSYYTTAEQLDKAGNAMDVLANALAIADAAVRSDIECCAHQLRIQADGGYWIYSTTDTCRLRAAMTDSEAATQPFAYNLAEQLELLKCTQRAAEYIRQRGNVFPWRMVDVPDMPGYVRFVDGEGRPVDPGAQA